MVPSFDHIPAAAEHPDARNFTVKMSGRLAALHIASLWCIAVAQPLFGVLRRSPEFFVAHDSGPLDLLGLVALLCLAVPAAVALALWIAGRLAPGLRPGAAGSVIGALAAAVALAALKPLGGWHVSVPLAAAAGCGAAAGIAYIRFAPVRLFATFLSPALVVVPAAFLLNPASAGLLAAADEQPPLEVSFRSTPPVVVVIFDSVAAPLPCSTATAASTRRCTRTSRRWPPSRRGSATRAPSPNTPASPCRPS